MEHTPGKLEVLNNYIKKVGGDVIATTARNNAACRFEAEAGSLEDEANAEFIVRACNSHDELLEACKNVKALNSEFWLNYSMNKKQRVGGLINQVTTILEAAIANAEGKEV